MHRLALLLALAPGLALAQPTCQSLDGQPATRIGQAEQIENNAPGYYRHHMPGEATIQVQVEGAVLNPGLYEVADETNMSQVLALSGGPRVDARDRQNNRRVELRIVRPQLGMIYGATLGDAITNPSVVPPLCNQDALLVEVVDRRQFGWQDAATLIGAAGTVAFLAQLLLGSN